MTLNEIKSALGIEVLNLNWAIDKDGVKSTEWLRHWNNETRVQIAIHKDVAAILKSSKDLAIKSEDKIAEGSQKKYVSKIIYQYTPVAPDMVF